MRLAILALLAAGCGGHASAPAVQPAAAPGPPVMRWVPANPTYVFASPVLSEGQRSLRDVIDLAGALAGVDLGDASRAASNVFGVDALHPDAVAAIGVDIHGSWAVFSEDLHPTLVVHLAAPDQMAAFLDRQRERGLVTQSVIVDKTEVFSAALPLGVAISWAIAGDWMWVHLTLPFARDDGTSWFAASHAAHGTDWADDWAWARAAAGGAAGLVGFLGHGAAARLIAKLPDAVACAKLVEPVGRAAVSLEGDGRRFAARIAFDVGSTQTLRGMIVPPPSGWAAATEQAAIAAQWNLDLAAARSWLGARFAPCLALAGGALARLDETGVRTARAAVLGFDPDERSGSAAIALDTTNSGFFERQLDRIPLRRTIERTRTFGAHKGASVAIPFSVTVEYVLEPKLVIVALGEGLLARLVAPGPASPPPIFALDVAPPAMSAAAWEAVLQALAQQRLSGSPGRATKRVVEHLRTWRDGHLAVTAEPTTVVFALSGNRR